VICGVSGASNFDGYAKFDVSADYSGFRFSHLIELADIAGEQIFPCRQTSVFEKSIPGGITSFERV
jgi:hypothetical protein